MDLSIVLALQELRQSAPSFVETFFSLLSYLGDGPGLAFIIFIVYWCIDKRAGQFAIVAFGVGNYIDQLIKNIACVYRPWIREPAIEPAKAALKGASGYSFPSGHVVGTTSTLGSLTWLARKNHAWVAVVCIIVIALMMFARPFLGVHTPQDVIVAFLIALAAIALTQMFFNWIDRHDKAQPRHNKDIVVMVVALLFCISSIVFVILKPYPADYVNGILLVDPVDMQCGSFDAAGVLAGVAVSWVLERRLVRFATNGLDMRTRVVRGVIGVILTGMSYIVLDIGLKMVLPHNWAKLFIMFALSIISLFLAPFVFNKFENRRRYHTPVQN